MKKTVCLLLTTVLLMTCAAGCGSSEKRYASQYSSYVQSMFDVEYKGITDEYLKLTDDTEEAACRYYENCMLYWAYLLADYYQISLVSDELEERMVEVTKGIFAHVKYEVADAVKTEDCYTVEVTVYPMMVTEGTEEAVMDFASDFVTRSAEGEYGDYENDMVSYEKWETDYANGVMDILEAYGPEMKFADPVTKTVVIVDSGDGYYGFSEEDYAEVESCFLY